MSDPTFGFTRENDRDRLAELGTLAGGLVHELKNPLGVMLLNAELLLSQSKDIAHDPAMRERLEKRLRRIVDSGKSLQAIVESFLGFARPARPDPDAVDINALLRDLVEEQSDLDERAAIQVTLRLDDNLALVPADRQHLRSVFLNVLKNAREALIERASDRKLLIVTRASAQQARVVIANNGPPLPQEVAAHLFQPFTSAKEGGTGLGLAIVKRLVEMHHGTVTASSEEHQGVSFTFEFPTPLGPAQPRAELPIPEAEAVVRSDDGATCGVRRAALDSDVSTAPDSVQVPTKKRKKTSTPHPAPRTPHE